MQNGSGENGRPSAVTGQTNPGSGGGGSLLSALGLHPTGSVSPRKPPSLTHTPSPVAGLNRRGTPQRLRKRNRLYFDDDHVSDDLCRGSPKKSLLRPIAPTTTDRVSNSTSSIAQTRDHPTSPATPVRESSAASDRVAETIAAAMPMPAVPASPVRPQSRLCNGESTARSLHSATSPLLSARASSPVLPPSVLSVDRQRQAHQLGLFLRNLLKLPKAHKFVCYEWFYSTLDECLLYGSNDFLVCLREQYPRLKTTKMARREWSKLRRQMGKPRRCSPAFFLEERNVLQSMRQKVRSLQSLQRKAYDRSFIKQLPEEIPLQLSIGTRVTVRLTHPEDGLFNGTVQAVHVVDACYRVSFDRPSLGTRTVPDYNVRAIDPVDTVPTISFVRSVFSHRSLVFSTPPRPGVTASATGTACHLGSPLSNDPLMSAFSPTKCELNLLDEEGVVNGYSIRFLLQLVQLNKILIAKREHVAQLDNLNSEAEQRQLYSETMGQQFQQKYARLVLRLETLNRHLHEKISSVQTFCHKMLPDVGLVPDVLPTHMKRLCDEEARRQVVAAAASRPHFSLPQTVPPSALKLIASLTSLLLQVKNFADNEMNPFELSSLGESMREIAETLHPDNAAVFQDHVQVNVHHVQNLLVARWNARHHHNTGRRTNVSPINARPTL